ncbi:phage head morphogenesis protein [Formosa sp. A9]|uniref:phage head morphogenesis protein n=1 Tax=Formosa sp. A9 TaxID=3442641 RepID=UPI003EC0BEA8
MHTRLDFLYDCQCDTCKHQTEVLNLAANPFKNLLKAAENAYKALHKKGSYHPNDLNEVEAYQDLIFETNGILSRAFKDNDMSPKMLESLENDVFLFSGLKTHAQLFEASRLLLTEDKTVKSFATFSKDVASIKSNYNENYLEAEYDFAVGSVQMAERWDNFSDSNRYYLQYRTAADDKVRDSHEALHGITLPKDDPFWDKYLPTLGWRCRCTAVQVLKELAEISDSKEALKRGEKATTQVGKNGKNKLEIFRFNAGKQKVVFPPDHPYNKVVGAKKAKAATQKLNIKELKTTADVNQHFADFAKQHPHYFAKGFKHIKTTTKRGVNGYTYMEGDVYLKKPIMDQVREGINHIKKGLKTTLEQETALSTMHHEILHNSNKVGNVRMTTLQVRYMELANEFISRKRLPDFLKNLGGNLENKVLMNNRTNTGYNTMVRNYDALIDFVKGDRTKIINAVEKHLINENYQIQAEGLINAIADNTPYKLNKNNVRSLISYGLRSSEEHYKTYLNANKELLKTKRR